MRIPRKPESEMQELYRMLIETKERCNATIKRLDDMEERFQEFVKREEAINEIASFVKVMAQNIENLHDNVSSLRLGFREDLAEMKDGQRETCKRIDDVRADLDTVKYQPMREVYENKTKLRTDLWGKVVTALFGGGVVLVVGLLKMLYDSGLVG